MSQARLYILGEAKESVALIERYRHLIPKMLTAFRVVAKAEQTKELKVKNSPLCTGYLPAEFRRVGMDYGGYIALVHVTPEDKLKQIVENLAKQNTHIEHPYSIKDWLKGMHEQSNWHRAKGLVGGMVKQTQYFKKQLKVTGGGGFWYHERMCPVE